MLKNFSNSASTTHSADSSKSVGPRDGIAHPASSEDEKAHRAAMNRSELSQVSVTETRTLVGEKFRVKDSQLLRGTLSCVDARLVVSADAIIQQNVANAPGKLRFILPNTIREGADVIEAKKSELFDPAAEGRESASAPEASVSYLNAATVVAEVVAHNADVTTPTSKAYCGTSAAARALIKRCVPNLTDAELDAKGPDGLSISEKMSAACSSGATQAVKDLNSRVALASFLGSWLFLKSER
jgi:hypothetical protein